MSRLCCTLLIALLSIQLSQAQTDDIFYFGADLSYVNEMLDCGAEYRVDGEIQDPYTIFANYGANLVRARLWHSPDWTIYSTLDDVKRTFQHATDNGMSTMLDFHYSDTWADPSRQQIPDAWSDVAQDVDVLADAVYDYTYATLIDLYQDDLTPAFVQIGNETNSGMLLNESENLNWTKQAQLFNAGIRAVRDFSAETDTAPQIVLHVAQPENTVWWFSEAQDAGIIDYDVIGISYYPQWSNYTITDVGTQIANLHQQYDKDVMIVETAYGWTHDAVNETATNILSEEITDYDFSPAGQLAYLVDLTQNVISNGGLGVIYWEPAWVSTECYTQWGQGSHWENATFFDFNNNNELLAGINFFAHDYTYL